MKHNVIYKVESYDHKIKKLYWSYKCAEKYAIKLVRNDINCGVWKLSESTNNEWCFVIGC